MKDVPRRNRRLAVVITSLMYALAPPTSSWTVLKITAMDNGFAKTLVLLHSVGKGLLTTNTVLGSN